MIYVALLEQYTCQFAVTDGSSHSSIQIIMSSPSPELSRTKLAVITHNS